jgi:hypothetical protein
MRMNRNVRWQDNVTFSTSDPGTAVDLRAPTGAVSVAVDAPSTAPEQELRYQIQTA